MTKRLRSRAPLGGRRIDSYANAARCSSFDSSSGTFVAPTTDGKGRSIIRVSEIIPAPAPTPEQTAALKTELNRQLQTDIMAEYIAGLQARYGLSLNKEALKQALGGDRGAEGAGIE